MTTIVLPPELLTLIFEHLPQSDLHTCTKVDQLFHATATPILWRSPSFLHPASLHLFSRCLTIAKEPRGKLVRSLHFSELDLNTYVDDDFLLTIAPHLPLLDLLDLSSCQSVTDRSLIPLATHCPALEVLLLESSPCTLRTLFELAHQCPHLRVLNLRAAQNLPHLALLPFTRHRHLSSLVLTDCRWLADDTAQDIRRLPRLRSLELINCRSLSDVFLRALATGDLTDLMNVYLSGNPALTDAGIVPFVEAHPALHEISLARCAITDITIHTVAARLPALRLLDVAFCAVTSAAIRTCVVRCPDLEMVGLTGCEDAAAADFPELGFEGGELDVLWLDQIAMIRTVEMERLEREMLEAEEMEREGAGASGAELREAEIENDGKDNEEGEGEEEDEMEQED
ncbi:hypothetical protein BC938DRAFT_476650 [Jimgerdemannia flammicorona]|uniref:F-box domain-containing protein n=1 Tax=Jimgerdemannia flammicorona TaxID=994334 RepID=A0A433PFB6_9FUNG|nr:hypothetical protein BC938DRAFT_476650 [Jimgerdemannia flammicorona]